MSGGGLNLQQKNELLATPQIIVALDLPNVAEARDMCTRLDGVISVYKVGLELIYAGGLQLAQELVAKGHHVFLDAKLLDIGNTVERATASISALGVHMLTVHGSDRKTLKAAVAGRGNSDMKLLAVTVMTNLTSADLAEQGISGGLLPSELVLRRAKIAHEVGFDGVISSGWEAAAIRAELGGDFLIITPGIRPSGGSTDDQARVMTPAKALAAGANHLVIGRPIIQASNPRAAASALKAEIA